MSDDTRTTQLPSFDSIDRVQTWVLSSILRHGEPVRPRGMETLEICPVAFTLTSPRRRCIANPKRRWSLPLALGELCWHLAGSNDVRFIEYYGKRWRDFADGVSIRGSCYGHKVFTDGTAGRSQWARLLEVLRNDPCSRRAMLTFFDPDDGLDARARDVACASSLQVVVRSGQLHAFVHMRSNDAIWGLPYDVFLFTMLQEIIAREIGVELGSYTHFASSLHIYEQHYDLAREIVEFESFEAFEMPPIQAQEQLPKFLQLERDLRLGGGLMTPPESLGLNPYWHDLLAVLDWYRTVKLAGGYSRVTELPPEDSPYRRLLANQMSALIETDEFQRQGMAP